MPLKGRIGDLPIHIEKEMHVLENGFPYFTYLKPSELAMRNKVVWFLIVF